MDIKALGEDLDWISLNIHQCLEVIFNDNANQIKIIYEVVWKLFITYQPITKQPLAVCLHYLINISNVINQQLSK